jgi:hypothetical protein
MGDELVVFERNLPRGDLPEGIAEWLAGSRVAIQTSKTSHVLTRHMGRKHQTAFIMSSGNNRSTHNCRYRYFMLLPASSTVAEETLAYVADADALKYG